MLLPVTTRVFDRVVRFYYFTIISSLIVCLCGSFSNLDVCPSLVDPLFSRSGVYRGVFADCWKCAGKILIVDARPSLVVKEDVLCCSWLLLQYVRVAFFRDKGDGLELWPDCYSPLVVPQRQPHNDYENGKKRKTTTASADA